jgi:hypothetical protein
MITFIASMAAGNAVQVFLDPPEDAVRCRVLRKRADTIGAADDPGSNVVFDGLARHFIDTTALVNGTEYFYRPFYLIDGQWSQAPSRAVTPAATYADLSPDALDVLRTRIEQGFAAVVQRGLLLPPSGNIPVLLATPSIESASFPFVSVHMQGDSPAERFVGEVLAPDALVGIGDDAQVASVDGWLSRYQFLIIVWCQNGDIRNAIRKALKAIVLANLPILEDAGLMLIEPSFADIDDMNTYPMPMYQATCTLSCLAPAAVESRTSTVQDVTADLFQS